MGVAGLTYFHGGTHYSVFIEMFASQSVGYYRT